MLRTNDSPKKEYRLSFKDGNVNTNMISFDSPLEGEDVPFGSRKNSIMLGLEKSSVSLSTNPEVRTSHADEILKGESTPMTPERLKIWLEKSELTNFLSLIEGNIS